MHNPTLEANVERSPRNTVRQDETDAQSILEGPVARDQSLEQVREILFGAESRRAEAERRALDDKTSERFGKLEAEHERRFEKLMQELVQRFETTCAMLEAEANERRDAMRIQQGELIARLEKAAATLGQAKTDRDELAGLLTEVASRLRSASVA
jgi:hypothetical protein